ncbi:MAG: hypothetical protein J0L79_01160 [Rickettsiales bacterium]|nr:hypothetical protein [Rickettsiales bacterium]
MSRNRTLDDLSEAAKKIGKEIDAQREPLSKQFQAQQQLNNDGLDLMKEHQKKFDKVAQKFDKLLNEVDKDSEVLSVAEARRQMHQAQDGDPYIKARANYKQAVENERAGKNMARFVDSCIMPVIDDLLDAHKDGSGVSVKEINVGIGKILDAMCKNGIISVSDKLNYQYKEDENGKTAFAKDVEASLNLQDESQKLKSPDLKPLKDKLLHFVSKICASIGQPQLIKHCRKHMSQEAQSQFKMSEKAFSTLLAKVIKNLDQGQSTPIKRLDKAVNQKFTDRTKGHKSKSGGRSI